MRAYDLPSPRCRGEDAFSPKFTNKFHHSIELSGRLLELAGLNELHHNFSAFVLQQTNSSDRELAASRSSRILPAPQFLSVLALLHACQPPRLRSNLHPRERVLIQIDPTSDDSIQCALSAITSHHTHIDILINNGGAQFDAHIPTEP